MCEQGPLIYCGQGRHLQAPGTSHESYKSQRVYSETMDNCLCTLLIDINLQAKHLLSYVLNPTGAYGHCKVVTNYIVNVESV